MAAVAPAAAIDPATPDTLENLDSEDNAVTPVSDVTDATPVAGGAGGGGGGDGGSLPVTPVTPVTPTTPITNGLTLVAVKRNAIGEVEEEIYKDKDDIMFTVKGNTLQKVKLNAGVLEDTTVSEVYVKGNLGGDWEAVKKPVDEAVKIVTGLVGSLGGTNLDDKINTIKRSIEECCAGLPVGLSGPIMETKMKMEQILELSKKKALPYGVLDNLNVIGNNIFGLEMNMKKYHKMMTEAAARGVTAEKKLKKLMDSYYEYTQLSSIMNILVSISKSVEDIKNSIAVPSDETYNNLKEEIQQKYNSIVETPEAPIGIKTAFKTMIETANTSATVGIPPVLPVGFSETRINELVTRFLSAVNAGLSQVIVKVSEQPQTGGRRSVTPLGKKLNDISVKKKNSRSRSRSSSKKNKSKSKK